MDMRFDSEKSFVDTFTVDDLVFDCYRTFYCMRPITGMIWDESPSEEFFRLNIKVPHGLKDVQKAPILFYNPWGGDFGHPAPAPGTLNNAMKKAVIRAGWILVEPGMRGNNCTSGTPGEKDYHHYGKLPRPLADLKAALRYLRWEDNKDLIPGNKERIWIAGVSSGGCASSIIGTSGDSELFAPYLEEIGALPGSDAVYGAAPSCPVMNRGNGDGALAFERWDEPLDSMHERNRYLWTQYLAYFNSLQLRAEKDLEAVNIHCGDRLTADNIKDYIYEGYVKPAALRFFADLGTKEKTEAYLGEERDPDPMYSTAPAGREWIHPVFDQEGRVIDILGSYRDFWRYTVGEDFDRMEREINWQFDKPFSAPRSALEENGVINTSAGSPRSGLWGSLSSYSFGKENDYGAVYSKAGRQYLRDVYQMEMSDAYEELITMQRNAVDPMYFIMQGKGKTAERWVLRTGTVDLVTPHPNFIALGTALMNRGKDVDMAFIWDERHGLTSDIDSFLRFAEKA